LTFDPAEVAFYKAKVNIVGLPVSTKNRTGVLWVIWREGKGLMTGVPDRSNSYGSITL